MIESPDLSVSPSPESSPVEGEGNKSNYRWNPDTLSHVINFLDSGLRQNDIDIILFFARLPMNLVPAYPG